MTPKNRSNLVIGGLLIFLGIVLLLGQWMPGLRAWLGDVFDWPFIVVGVGLFLLVMGLLTRTPAMAVPACIVGGIGLLLFWQNATGNWDSWTYAWTLIPGFVGVGILLAGFLGGDTRESSSAGLWLITISLILYAVFGSFLGGWGQLWRYWPAVLILLGLSILVRSFLQHR